MIDVKEVLEESLPVLTICAAISVLSGAFLGDNQELFRTLPGILVIVPSFIAVNGNISSVMSSRLSSALHTGLIKPHFRGKGVLRVNIFSMILIASVVFTVLGFVGGAINYAISGEAFSVEVFPMITLVAGLVTVSILLVGSILTSYLTYRRGLDPDNVVVPILTTVGDFVGIVVLLLIAGVVI